MLMNWSWEDSADEGLAQRTLIIKNIYIYIYIYFYFSTSSKFLSNLTINNLYLPFYYLLACFDPPDPLTLPSSGGDQAAS